MDRRNLLVLAVSLATAGLAPRIARAGDDDEECDAVERVVARIGKNHGHVFKVSVDDVMAGADKTYDLRGAAAHPHEVTLTACHFKRLRNGKVVRVESSRTGHVHRLLVVVAPAVDPPDAIPVCDVSFGGSKDEHELIVPASHLASPIERTYHIQGLASHDHEVTIPVEKLEKLARGATITVKSTATDLDGHNHVVSVTHKKA